jgi:CRISPR-associated protein Cas1
MPPVNAMLNYASAVLESQVRIATVSQGLDPPIGCVHRRRHRRVALVYDLMEPLRPADGSRGVELHTFTCVRPGRLYP